MVRMTPPRDEAVPAMTLRQRFLGAAFWLAGSDLLLTVFGMGVMLVLARLLQPEDYGTVAMATVFIGLVNQTNAVGLGQALVRMERITADSERLTFTYAVISSIVLYGAVFLLAPLAGAFYHEPRVVPLLRVMSFSVVIRAFYIVPHSLLRREFDMKRHSKVQVLATLTDAGSTVVLAVLGFGIWALAFGPLVSHLAQVAGMSFVRPWHIGLRFRGDGAEALIRFAVGVNANLYLWYWYVSADNLIIGRALGGAALGIFTMAMNLSKLTWNKLWLVVNPLLLPLFAEARTTPGKMGQVFLRVTHWVALITFPASIGLLVAAQDAVKVLLPDKWADIVVPLQWLCLLGGSRAIAALMSPVLLAVGKVRLEVFFSLACGIVMPAAFVVALPWGVSGVAAAWALVFPVLVATFLLRPVLRAVQVGVGEYVRALRTPVAASLVMAVLVHTVGRLLYLPAVPGLCFKVAFGALCYFALITWWEGNPYREFRRLLADTRAGARS
jgi:O-antigen/teichoic acid export membrane protein